MWGRNTHRPLYMLFWEFGAHRGYIPVMFQRHCWLCKSTHESAHTQVTGESFREEEDMQPTDVQQFTIVLTGAPCSVLQSAYSMLIEIKDRGSKVCQRSQHQPVIHTLRLPLQGRASS